MRDYDPIQHRSRRLTKIVLPGVGHFASTANLGRSGSSRTPLSDAIYRGVPFLGICVGMQWMFQEARNRLKRPDSALLPGECERFPASVKSPHVGWNQLEIGSVLTTVARSPAGIVCLFHAFVSGSGDATPRLHAASTAAHFPRRWNATTCLECSSIRKNPVRVGLKDPRQFLCSLTC